MTVVPQKFPLPTGLFVTLVCFLFFSFRKPESQKTDLDRSKRSVFEETN